MQNKGLIKFFAIIFTIACIYQLSFTFVANGIVKDAKEFAKGDSQKELKYLKDLKKKFQEGSFKLTNKYEDCHSAIEFYLTKELGELGKKVHTGRSRNDQVIVAMRLFAKQNLINFKIEKTIDSCITLEQVDKSKRMIDTFVIITALEDDIIEEELESIIRLFWLKIDLKKQSIFETKLK